MSETTYLLPFSSKVTAGQQKAVEADPGSFTVSTDDTWLVKALRCGDEAAFVALLDHYYPSMMRVTMIYVPNWVVAEEVVQETWMSVVQNLHRFEERSSLKTWIFSILVKLAQKHGQRERRSVPFSSLPDLAAQDTEPAEDADQFLPAHHPQWAGGWASFPRSWEHIPEDRLLAQETRVYVRKAIDALPQRQREVIVLCDIEGWTSDEVCHLLGLTKVNQRVLLSRARSRVRQVLDQYFTEE